MQDVHIHSGDILIVDRALEPKDEQIVVAILNGEFTVKWMHLKGDAVHLVAANSKYPPLRIEDPDTFQVWGVVTYVIHNMK